MTKLYRGGGVQPSIIHRKEGKHWVSDLSSYRISERRSEAVNREVISRG